MDTKISTIEEINGNLDEEEVEWVDEYEGFEDILKVINPQGKYQKLFLYGFLCPMSILYSLWSAFVYVFFIPKHWCHDPNWAQNFSTYEEWKNSTIPMKTNPDGKEEFSSCTMFNEHNVEVSCKYGWEYDRSELELTMPSEFNWVCDKQDYTTIIFTVSGIAAILGMIFLGPITDKYGRRKIFVIFTIVDHLAGIIRLFLPKYFEAFLGITIFTSLIGASAEIIVQELTDSEYRSWISATTFTVYVFGMAAVPGLVYLIRDWFYIALVSIVPRTIFVIGYIFFFYIPESPRWLISVGRIQEAKQIIKDVARINGTYHKLNENELDLTLQRLSQDCNIRSSSSKPFVGMITLLRRPRIAKNALLLAIALAANGFIYGGITLNTPYMPGNQFISFFLLAIIEIPSSILGGYLMQICGRRWTPAIFFSISSLACFNAAFNIDSPILLTICIVLSKFSINLTALVGTVQEVEIFPTQFRATGSSFTGMLSQTLCLGMPMVINLGRQNPSIPYFAFGLCSVIGLLCAISLPETLHQNLPDTLEEANDFGKSHKFWSFQPQKSFKRKNPLKNQIQSSTSESIQVANDREHSFRGRGTSVRRESVVKLVSHVTPTRSMSRNRRQSVINYVGS